jgi:hypothetical protein
VAQREWRLVLQQLLELAVPDHLVQRIDARRGGAHDEFPIADDRLSHIGGSQALIPVLLDDERLHADQLLRFPSFWAKHEATSLLQYDHNSR